MDYFCVGLSARPRIGAGNRLWHRLHHGVLDETCRPFDVLLNNDSKRKTSSTVPWKKGERLFGQDALDIVHSLAFFLTRLSDSDSCIQGSRFPSDTFTHLKTLLGVPVQTYLAESARRTVDLIQADGTNWAVEELVAMKFACIKHLTELVANEKRSPVFVP